MEAKEYAEVAELLKIIRQAPQNVVDQIYMVTTGAVIVAKQAV